MKYIDIFFPGTIYSVSILIEMPQSSNIAILFIDKQILFSISFQIYLITYAICCKDY